MKLVIVESPAKCATIKRYLGEDYIVKASLGHVRDLATSGKGGLGVDVEAGFKPNYIINKEKQAVVRGLKEDKKKCDEVILATDPDREGEAIAWHLAEVLDLDPLKTKRLEFHEITRESITNAMEHPRIIDQNLVASQETRRIVDRIIGFKLSTLLFKKMKSRSAGRVQSATLKMIHDHENEIAKFVPEEYWNILVEGQLNAKNIFNLNISTLDGQKVEVHNEKEANDILARIPDEVKVVSIERNFKSKESREPFTTSTLQQEAFAKLKFKTKKTQSIAQQLYEGIEVGGEHMGLITYMRTDSTRLSPIFIARAQKYITETYGEQYLGRVKKAHISENMQDAHEAIRPSSNHKTPESIRPYLTNDQYNLYKLIYNRCLASLMKPKKEEILTVTLEGNGVVFKFDMSRTVFKGYEILEGKKEDKDTIVDVKENDVLSIISKKGEQKFTQPPAHYSEAKIVKLMEEVGIGRPSTYASTIDLLNKRKYIEDEGGMVKITEQGARTAHVLQKFFPDIVNVKYTASMEKRLDEIQEGSEGRNQMLEKFYYPFIKEVDSAMENMYKDDEEKTGEICPLCGHDLIVREGKHGKFIGCSNFPKCNYVKREEKAPAEETGEMCPVCGKPLVYRTSRGRKFVACSGYPSCKYIKPEVGVEVKENGDVVEKICPKCGHKLVKKKGKYGPFLGCSNYPKCNYMEKIPRKKRK